MQGGATRFDMLNLAVRPEKGKALLFFPAFADGTSDPRQVWELEAAQAWELGKRRVHVEVEAGGSAG